MDEIESLEHQLRSLPQKAPPDGLLQRLLDDIPAVGQTSLSAREGARQTRMSAPLADRSSTWNTALVALAAALFIAATVSVFYPFPPNSAGHSDRAVSAEYVLHHSISNQETDPCSILPPFPES
jgi:hypothetical protein